MKNTPSSSRKSIFGAMKYVVVASALAATLLLPKISTAQGRNRDFSIVPHYVPTTRAFIEYMAKLTGEDIKNLRVFTDQDMIKRQKQKPEDLDYSGAYVYVDPQGKSYYRYSPDMLRVALDTIASPTIRSASEYREQKFTAVTESEFRRWSKLNNADTPLLDQISSKEGTKCYMTTSVNNHMGDRDPANYYYWIDYDYPGTVRYSIETHQELFCGVTLNKLTPDQKKLYDNLSSEERTVLSQKITIDINKGQIEFIQAKLALQDKDQKNKLTEPDANIIAKKLKNDRRLPKDIDYNPANQSTLNPLGADYDAMILEMPGDNINKKVENFMLLTGMRGYYWTSQKRNDGLHNDIYFVCRGFFPDPRERNRSSQNGMVTSSVRLIRSLP